MTHKQVVPTVDMLQASVRSMTARSLDVQDLARIKALCPDMVHLAYVPTAALRTERAGKRRRTRMDDCDDMYTPPARDENTHTLLFEFLAVMPLLHGPCKSCFLPVKLHKTIRSSC